MNFREWQKKLGIKGGFTGYWQYRAEKYPEEKLEFAIEQPTDETLTSRLKSRKL